MSSAGQIDRTATLNARRIPNISRCNPSTLRVKSSWRIGRHPSHCRRRKYPNALANLIARDVIGGRATVDRVGQLEEFKQTRIAKDAVEMNASVVK